MHNRAISRDLAMYIYIVKVSTNYTLTYEGPPCPFFQHATRALTLSTRPPSRTAAAGRRAGALVRGNGRHRPRQRLRPHSGRQRRRTAAAAEAGQQLETAKCNSLDPVNMVRREGLAHLSKGVGKAVGNRKPRGLGRRVRVNNLQQQPRAAAAAEQPQRQLHKKILGVLGRRAAQGTGTWRWKPNLVLGKVVPVVWCEATKLGLSRAQCSRMLLS